jgi:hypothetical protein
LGRERVYPSRANAAVAGENDVVDDACGPPCGKVTQMGFGPGLVDAFFDWITRVSVGGRAPMGMTDAVRSRSAFSAAKDNVG